jgi:ABC-type transporter Mla subunit MlaD
MSEKKSYFRLGLFVVVGLGAALLLLFILGGRQLLQPTFEFETYFNESIAGLEIGSPVKFRGVPVGEVDVISTSGALYERDVRPGKRKGYIVVRCKLRGSREQVAEIRENLSAFIKGGVRAKTQLAGITGQQFIMLDIEDPKNFRTLPFDWKPEYPYLPSVPSTTGVLLARIQSFLASLDEADVSKIGKNLNTLLVTANKKLDDLDMRELSKDAVAALTDARKVIDHLDEVITKAPIDEAVRNFSQASASAGRVLGDPKIGQSVANIEAVTDRLRKLADAGEFDRITKNLDDLVARLDAMVADNQYDVRVIIQDLRVTANNLRELSASIKRYPAGALIGGPPAKVEIPKESAKEPSK